MSTPERAIVGILILAALAFVVLLMSDPTIGFAK